MRPGLSAYAYSIHVTYHEDFIRRHSIPTLQQQGRVSIFFEKCSKFGADGNRDYLHHLQHRKKWQEHSRNLKLGDLVQVKDDEATRNEWPTGIAHRAFPSSDELVRKVEIRVVKDMKRVLCVRPVSDLVTLLEVEE